MTEAPTVTPPAAPAAPETGGGGGGAGMGGAIIGGVTQTYGAIMGYLQGRAANNMALVNTALKTYNASNGSHAAQPEQPQGEGQLAKT